MQAIQINIENCEFMNSISNLGGSLYIILAGINSLNIKNCYFGNTKTTLNRKVFGYGGAIYINSISASPKIMMNNLTFYKTTSKS